MEYFHPANAPDYTDEDLCESCLRRPKVSPRERTCGRDECIERIYGHGSARSAIHDTEIPPNPAVLGPSHLSSDEEARMREAFAPGGALDDLAASVKYRF